MDEAGPSSRMNDAEILALLNDLQSDDEDLFPEEQMDINEDVVQVNTVDEDVIIEWDDVTEDEEQNNDAGRQWSNHVSLKKHVFSGKQTFKGGDKLVNTEPIEFFNLLFTVEFLQMVCNETNNYAETVFLQESTTEYSRITHWKPIDCNELRVFLGVLFHMGTVKLNRLSDYWKQSNLFSIPFFSKCMARNRFLLILRCLHFNSNEDFAGTNDRLYKIRPLINHFNNIMNDIFEASQNLCIDESMIPWRGRLSFRQFIKGKRHRYGVKAYMLCEKTGLVLKLLIYSGANDELLGGGSHASKVVMNLMEGKLNKGHSLYMDNFYNSVDLAETLLENQTYCTGTLRTNRVGNPKDILKRKLKSGETVCTYSNTGVCVGKWFDRRDVSIISTEHSFELMICQSKRGEVRKPIAIHYYNKNMSGIDLQDQMQSYYSCERKTLRWYKKLGIHIFQIMLLNAYHLYRQYTVHTKHGLYEFRLNIIDNLIQQQIKPNLPKRMKLSKEHVLQKIEKKNVKGETLRKRCFLCSKNKKQTRTIYHCIQCPKEPGFCVACFHKYHINIEHL